MVHDQKSKVVIVGGGPAGCMCAYYLQKIFDVIVIDMKSPLVTILPTGGGRCNICHAEYDFKELASNYPRGEKFLYSIFSKFGTADTVDFFENIGIETYVQDDLRIFPTSNSSKVVREKFLNALKHTKFIKEEVLRVNKLENSDNMYSVVTNMGAYKTDYIIIATGGHASYKFIEMLGHKIIDPKPALVGLVTKEDFSSISGVSINDVLFTHKGVSGPRVYKISSLRAKDKFPYNLTFDFIGEIDLQSELNANPHKDIKNLLSEHVPKSFAEFVLNKIGFNPEEKCCKIDGRSRDKILKSFQNFEITVVGTSQDGETVTCGGVDLREINPKNLESKILPQIYFCGEVMDIDGFCGGFNLQNCWSTAYVASQAILDCV